MKNILSDFYDHIKKYNSLDCESAVNSFIIKFELTEEARRVTALKCVANKMNLNFEKLISRTRERDYVDARFMIMTSLQKDKSYSSIKAAKFVNRDHVSALRAVKEVEKFTSFDHGYLEKYMAVREVIISTI